VKLNSLLHTVFGYRPRMLAVRSIEGVSSARLFRLHLFWISTFLGFTVPYRIWFKRNCDYLRVTVVKETSASSATSAYWTAARNWLPSRATMQPYVTRGESNFRSFMQGQSLYAKAAASQQMKTESSVLTTAEEGTPGLTTPPLENDTNQTNQNPE
jgi:hypothetical protein